MTEAINLKDGDGGGGERSLVDSYEVEVVDNGFIVNVRFEDGVEIREVYHSLDDVFKLMQESL